MLRQRVVVGDGAHLRLEEMASVNVDPLPNSEWAKRIRISGFTSDDPLEIFNRLEGIVRPSLQDVLARGRTFLIKVDAAFIVDIPSQGKYDVMKHIYIIPFEVGVHRHGRDGNGHIDLQNIISFARERLWKRMEQQGKDGSEIIYKEMSYMDWFIMPRASTRRLQPRRVNV